MLIKYLILTIFIFILILSFTTILRKSVLDKLLCINMTTNLIVVLICLLSSYKFNQSYIDIAIIYGLLSYISIMAFLRFFITQHRSQNND